MHKTYVCHLLPGFNQHHIRIPAVIQFLANTFTFAICRRPSLCRLSSVVCLSRSVHPPPQKKTMTQTLRPSPSSFLPSLFSPSSSFPFISLLSRPLSPPLPFLPILPSLRSRSVQLRSAVSSPSGVWGGAPAEIEFGAFQSTKLPCSPTRP